MGHVYADVTFTGPKGAETVGQALVDTGATRSMIPADMARCLGLRPAWKQRMLTADGRETEAGIALTRVAIDGRSDVVQVAILAGAKAVLVGVETLEILGLRVDPSARPPRIEATRDFTSGLL